VPVDPAPAVQQQTVTQTVTTAVAVPTYSYGTRALFLDPRAFAYRHNNAFAFHQRNFNAAFRHYSRSTAAGFSGGFVGAPAPVAGGGTQIIQEDFRRKGLFGRRSEFSRQTVQSNGVGSVQAIQSTGRRR
jgi:hypothetical protein